MRSFAEAIRGEVNRSAKGCAAGGEPAGFSFFFCGNAETALCLLHGLSLVVYA
jgi:hypothetical protein